MKQCAASVMVGEERFPHCVASEMDGEKRFPHCSPTKINREDRLTGAVEEIANAVKQLQVSQQTLSAHIDERLGELEKRLGSQVNHLANKCDTLQCDVDAMHDRCCDMREENAALLKKVNHLEERLETADNQSCQNNLMFFGIPHTASKLWTDCEAKVRDVIKNDLKVTDNVIIELAKRVGKAILVKFQSVKHKELVLKSAKKLRLSHIFVKEDFPPRAINTRKNLQPLLRSLREDGRKTFLKFDKVVCEDTVYTYNTNSQTIEQQPRRHQQADTSGPSSHSSWPRRQQKLNEDEGAATRGRTQQERSRTDGSPRPTVDRAQQNQTAGYGSDSRPDGHSAGQPRGFGRGRGSPVSQWR
ncbi:hypothetical protein ACOMHN_003613 [Nucella lapillus]